MTNFESKTFILRTLIILIPLVFVPLSFVMAASGVSLYITPSSGNYNVGNLINVSMKINTEGETINAVKATLSFNENLEVQSISKSGSIFGLWIEDPSYDNSLRTIRFGGAGAGTTYKGSAGKIISIIFKAVKTGEGRVSFSSTLVKYGATTIEVDSAEGGSYSISVPCNCTSWQDKTCGGNDCSSDQRFQMRTCVPSGCALESRCVDDSSCVSQPLPVEGEEEEEKGMEEVEEPIEEKAVVTFPKEKLPQKGLLASINMVWEEISKSAFLTIIVILCLIGLVLIGIREWRLFRKKGKPR